MIGPCPTSHVPLKVTVALAAVMILSSVSVSAQRERMSPEERLAESVRLAVAQHTGGALGHRRGRRGPGHAVGVDR